MSARDGFDILLDAAKAASNRYADDFLRAQAKGSRHVEGLGDVARQLQRAVDFAGAELVVLGLNGREAEGVLTCLLCGLIPPPYPMGDDNDQS
jgi:hypothetical protein